MITVPSDNNELLRQTVDRINDNTEIKTLWRVMNVNAINRLGMSDHGPIHFQIVANISLRLLRILKKNEVKTSVETGFDLDYNYAEVIVFLASICHDLGMSISRPQHEEFSLFITNQFLREVIDFMPIEEKTIVISEVLHAIISHRKGGTPITLEAGIVRVADALDMSEGRSRIPYEKGDHNIHSISAAAINGVDINEGKDVPIEIEIRMNNSAGAFQIDDLMAGKIKGSGLEKYISIKAFIDGKTEKKLIDEFIIDKF